MDKIVITTIGLLLLAFIYWFFFGKKEEIMEVTQGKVEIIVEGGYKPETITIPKGKPTTLTFFRKDPSSCLEEVVLANFKIRQSLPLNQKTSVSLTPQKTGTFPFSCGMGMFHGKVVVKEA